MTMNDQKPFKKTELCYRKITCHDRLSQWCYTILFLPFHFLRQTSISFYIYHSHSSAQIPNLSLQTVMFTFNLVGFKCCYFSLLNQQITYRLTSQNVSLISEIFSNSIEYPFISRFGKACSQASLHSTQRLLPFFVKFFLGKTTLEKSLMCALSYWTKTMKT